MSSETILVEKIEINNEDTIIPDDNEGGNAMFAVFVFVVSLLGLGMVESWLAG